MLHIAMTEPMLNKDLPEDQNQKVDEEAPESSSQELPSESDTEDESKGSGTKWFLILLIIAVVVIGGIYLYDRSQDKQAAEDAEKNAIMDTIDVIFEGIEDAINTEPEKNTCVATSFNGNTYEHGQSYTSDDGCQTCECNDGSWNCQTDEACLNPPKANCTYNGTTYEDGETFPAGDDCNTCECTDGAVDCTSEVCEEEPSEETESQHFLLKI